MAIIIYNKLGSGSELRLSTSGVNSPTLKNGQSWTPDQDDLQRIFHPATAKPGYLSLSTPWYENPGASSIILPSDNQIYTLELNSKPITDQEKAKKAAPKDKK